MSRYPVGEAWLILGKDPKEIFERILAHASLDARLNEAETALVEAKKLARSAMAKSHPDVGGDSNEFLRIQKALACIEQNTEAFRILVANKKQEMERQNNRRGLIVIK